MQQGKVVSLLVQSFLIVFLWEASLVSCSPLLTKSPPTVHLGQGILQGTTEISRGGRSYNVFYGVPFGKVEKRFEMSKPADSWTGVKMATVNGPECINTGFVGGAVLGSEDCLNLNVFTPKLPSNESDGKLLPVLVWIYGGGFVGGSNQAYGGSYLMDEDVVLVVINYRLGAFGFLNAGVSGARGNQGMKDQVLALRWVRDNIAHFSGDKNKVTIFGESAGGISVSLLTVSPMAQGLFSRAIMQSGTAGMPFVYHGVNGRDLAVKLAKEVDCPSSNMQYLVECLQKLDTKVIAPFARVVHQFGFDESAINMGPSYETYLPPDNSTEDVFLSEDPYNLALAGNFSKVPMIIGIVAFEMFSMVSATIRNETSVKKLNNQWGRVMPNALFISNTAEDPALIGQAIRSHFLGDEYINETILSKYEELYSDRHFVHSTRVFAELYAKHVPVYLYNFTQMVPIVKHGLKDHKFIAEVDGEKTRRNPGHGDEIAYLFDGKGRFLSFFARIGKGHEDEKFSKEMIATWVAFADTGKPNGPWGVSWPEFKSDQSENGTSAGQKWLLIENPPKVEPLPESWEANNKFWKSLNIKELGGKWKSEEL
ncbi:Esterase E4 [Folsomia candida]|uniref:Esterase E4 n=2 Tax=Folsomia candida TaxID=158441 RepID=A0A226E0N9_FOLCA|nr:Esterase E4 [Folsomia candida]